MTTVITAAQLSGSGDSIVTLTPISNSNYEFDSGTNIQQAFYGESAGAYIGNSFKVYLFNDSAFNITLSAGSGNILKPSNSTIIYPQVICEFLFVYTAGTEETVYLSSVNNIVSSTVSIAENKILIGNNLNTGIEVSVSGDATLVNTGALTLASTGVNAGSYGSSLQVPTYTVDTKGRLTAAANVAIQVASVSQSGIVNTTTQTFQGLKTFNQGLNAGSNVISSVSDPVSNQDSATKAYVDKAVISRTVTTVTTSYTVLSSDVTINVNTAGAAGALTITLPIISGQKYYFIRDTGGQADIKNITIATSGGNTIIGFPSLIIDANYTSLSLYNDLGTNWLIY